MPIYQIRPKFELSLVLGLINIHDQSITFVYFWQVVVDDKIQHMPDIPQTTLFLDGKYAVD